jgi:membrane carboxypeptidase/penicillin-binding protein PbpC
MLQEGGLKVTTTLDLNLQNIVQEEVTAGAQRNWDWYGGYNAASVVIDPKTGQILAMVGSRDYFDSDHDGNVNVAISPRSPGSSFKPYVYAIGFSKKYGAGSPLYDVRTDFGNGYTPENFTKQTFGLITARKALANSLNIPAVKMTALVGVDEVIKYAKEMGFSTMPDPSQISFSIGIGGAEVKLLDHVSAISTFAASGVHHAATPFLKIVDSQGKVIEEYKDQANKVFEPSVAYIISDILSDNNARSMIFGSNTPLAPGDRIFAAKTGTSENFRDAWTVGYAPNIAIGVWAGNNDGTYMSNSGDGIVAAAPIWRSIFDRVTSTMNLPIENFERPAGVEEVTVDALTGLLPGNGTSKTFTDLWASFAKPTEKSNVYSKYKVCKINGKLATGVEPPEAVEEKTFANIKSEMPDNENWNKPVRAWAAGAGFGPPPTEKCDAPYKEANRPKISIKAPLDGAEVSGKFTITVSPSAPNGISAIQIFFDGQKIAEGTGNSYSYTPKTNGNHKISARIIDKAYLTAEASVSITITGTGEGGTTPPAEEPTTPPPTDTPGQ